MKTLYINKIKGHRHIAWWHNTQPTTGNVLGTNHSAEGSAYVFF